MSVASLVPLIVAIRARADRSADDLSREQFLRIAGVLEQVHIVARYLPDDAAIELAEALGAVFAQFAQVPPTQFEEAMIALETAVAPTGAEKN